MSLVYPVLAQVLLTFVVILLNGRARVGAIRARQVRIREVALSAEAYPDDVKKISNNMHNQYETPILFYVLCGIAIYLGATGIAMTVLAWAYVASRVAHTAIHVTSNHVPRRFYVFTAGIAVLIAMWAVLVLHLLTA